LSVLAASGRLSAAATGGSSFARAERSGSRRGVGEVVFLDGAADQRRYRCVLGVEEVNRRHG
jgi:hypothetical protein